jgi:hypothetical protein
MVLAHCILGKFLGIGCHCFPLPLDVSTFSARCLHVQRRERPLAPEGELFVGEKCPDKFRLEIDFHVILEIFYMPQICDMGQTALLPLQRKACRRFFRNSRYSGKILMIFALFRPNFFDTSLKDMRLGLFSHILYTLQTSNTTTFYRC